MVKADLIDFPVLIDIIDGNLSNRARSDGRDIAFTIDQNATLSHEIEYYNSTSGHLVAWVKIPLLSSTTDTELYMYYGNADATNQQKPFLVWDSSYVMVQHLKETSGIRYDSTRNGNNATVYSTVSKSMAGKIDGVDTFGNGYELISPSFLPSAAITVELWLKPSSYSPTTWTKFMNTGPTPTSGIYGGQNSLTADAWALSLTWNSAAARFSTPNMISGYSWSQVAIEWNGTYCYAYQNGARVKEGAAAGAADWAGRPLFLGSNYWGGERFSGSLDEIRISNVSRSSDWIQTSYNNQQNPATFCSLGNEETLSPTPLIFDETPTNESVGVYTKPSLSVRAIDPNGQNMTIIFRERISSNLWQDIKTYENVGDGTYAAISDNMNKLGTVYYWSVCVTDGTGWVNKTFCFTTTSTILKQKWLSSPVPVGVSGVLIADVNHDGIEEVLQAGIGGVVCLNGTTGKVIWNVSDSNVGMMAKSQMADLDLDGFLEIVVPLESPAGLLVLHANNGTTYWRNQTGFGLQTYSSPVILDIDGDGYPEIFVVSTDVYRGLNGTGRLTSLSHDGKILYQTFVWRPCGGGLSIADADGDGEFELYMGDRFVYEPDNDYGKGVQSYWARNLTLRWFHPDVVCSSHIPMLVDVNGDGILEVVVGHLDGGVAVLNSTDGTAIRQTLGIPNDAPVHYQPSVYDIDGDGNLELLMADLHNETSDDLVIWDLVKWKIDARFYIGKCFYGPQVADANGDGIMEIIACNFKSVFIIDRTYHVIDAVLGLSGDISYKGEPQNIDGVVGLAGVLNYAVVQDIDGDGYSEMVVSTQGGAVYAFDLPARRPDPRPRTEVQFYSEYRRGVAEYVPPPTVQGPRISYIYPSNLATNVPLSLSELQFTIVDYQHDPMNYTVTTNPYIGSDQKPNVSDGRYNVSISNLAASTLYTWTISVTDGTRWANETYTFTTESHSPWMSADWRYRKRIAIDHTRVSADLSNFPVLISITDNDLASKAQPDGSDIAFADAEGNRLNHEIELYNSTTGSLISWVSVPQISSTTDTRIYMYYGNATSMGKQQDPSSVWDSGYVMVQHLEELAGVRYDSTRNGNNATLSGNVGKDSLGKIDGADTFGNGYERVQAGFLPTSAVTVELWFKPSSNQSVTWPKYLNTGPTTTRGIFGGRSSATADKWALSLSWDSGSKSFGTGDLSTGYSWTCVAITWSGTYAVAYCNGIKVREGLVAGTPDWAGKSLYLGSNYGGGELFKGSLDEIRISNISRSSDWIQTSYNDQKDPTKFCTIGNEETVPETPSVFAPTPQDKAINIPRSLSELSFNLTDPQNGLMNFTVVTNPNIISGSGIGVNVSGGKFAVPVSNLQYSTTYVWTVNVTDGTYYTTATYTFTTLPTEIPTQDTPILLSGNGGSIVCYNQSTSDTDGDRVTNIYNWYRNNASMANLLLPFETNASPKVKDYSGYSNDGIPVGGVEWTKDGKVGGAYSFNGGFIQIPGSYTLDGGGAWSELTVEHWIYLTDYTWSRTIAKFPSYEIRLIGGTICGGIWTPTGDPTTSGYNRVTYDNHTLQLNTWYHITLTYKSGVGLTLYVNGVAVATKLVSGNIQSSGSNPLYIGMFDYFKGKIDDVRIYPRCLSAAQINQTYFETKDGLSNSSTIVSQETNTGETWKCTVTPNDSHQDGITKTSNTFTIGYNNRPIAKNLIITPSTPRTDDNLTASYTYFDPDGDLESGTQIRWYKNGLLQPQLNDTLTVPANLTTKGETWFFTVKPSDGKDFGDLQMSSAVTIQNTPPSIAGVTITPNPAYATDTLTANPLSPYDADGDSITFTYQWRKYENGSWPNIAGATNQTLGPESFVQGDQIQVICIPYDGQNYGTPQTNIITIS